MNGRNYINLLTLRPGMTVYAGGGSFTRSANGTRAEDIGYLLDGLRNDDSFTGSSVLNAAIPAGDASTSLPIDAIQEFNTEQNPKAEFGWKPGAIVNAGIKSGTNSLHGTAFAFGRENLIPSMFSSLVELRSTLPGQVDTLVDYLARHIELDGELHTPLAFEMVSELCGEEDARWLEATAAARAAVTARVALWDAVVDATHNKEIAVQ